MKRYLIYCPREQSIDLDKFLQDHNIHFNSDWVYDPTTIYEWTWRYEIEVWLDEVDAMWLKLAIPDLVFR